LDIVLIKKIIGKRDQKKDENDDHQVQFFLFAKESHETYVNEKGRENKSKILPKYSYMFDRFYLPCQQTKETE
jgi:hypothetical protein